MGPLACRSDVVAPPGSGRAAVLSERLLRVLGEQPVTALHVDLAGVTFLDCCGVGALVAVRDVAVRAGIQMRVDHLQRAVRMVLEEVGLLGAFTGPVDGSRPGSEAPPLTA